MLICGSVEHVVRPVLTEHRLHSGLTVNTAHNHLTIHIREIPLHHEHNVVLGRLRLINQNHLFRLEFSHLPYNLHTYRPCRPGNQYSFLPQKFPYSIQIYLYLLARQQILYTYLLQLNIFI